MTNHMNQSKQMTATQQALWSLAVEIGGDAKLFAIAPNLRGCWERAIDTLTDEGIIDDSGILSPSSYGRLAEPFRNNWHEIDPGRAQRAHVIDKTIDQMRARIREMEEEKRALVDGTRAELVSRALAGGGR